MIENVEGFLQFVFNFVVDGVNRCFTGETDEIEDEHLKVISMKFNLKLTKKVDFLEACLGILTVISWQIPSNKGLQVLFDNFMVNMVQKIYADPNMNVLVRFRMCMLF